MQRRRATAAHAAVGPPRRVALTRHVRARLDEALEDGQVTRPRGVVQHRAADASVLGRALGAHPPCNARARRAQRRVHVRFATRTHCARTAHALRTHCIRIAHAMCMQCTPSLQIMLGSAPRASSRVTSSPSRAPTAAHSASALWSNERGCAAARRPCAAAGCVSDIGANGAATGGVARRPWRGTSWCGAWGSGGWWSWLCC